MVIALRIYLNSFVRFKERIPIGSKLAIMGVDNNSNPITSQIPIQIREMISLG